MCVLAVFIYIVLCECVLNITREKKQTSFLSIYIDVVGVWVGRGVGEWVMWLEGKDAKTHTHTHSEYMRNE